MMSLCKRLLGAPGFTLPMGVALLSLSALLIFVHAVSIRQIKEVGLPAATLLPQMEKRLALLKDQVEASELQTALGDGSAAEQLDVYVLPKQADLSRLLATFDLLRDHLARHRLLRSLSAIEVGEQQEVKGMQDIRAIPLTFEAQLAKEGMDKLLLLLELSGKLTVSDALSQAELSALVNMTEEENPASLTVLEQFLSLDLLLYARDAAAFENQVLRSLPSASFEQQFHAVLAQSSLAKARYLLGGDIGQLLMTHNLWPLQMLHLQKVKIAALPGGEYRLGVGVHAYVRP